MPVTPLCRSSATMPTTVDPRAACHAADADLSADGVLRILPVGARHRFVDHRDGLRARGVGRREPSPAHQARAHRLERLRRWRSANRPSHSRRAIPRSLRRRDRNRRSSSRAAARARIPPTARRQARAPSRSAADRSSTTFSGVSYRAVRHRHAHRQHVIGLESEIDAAERGEAPHHQARADHEHDRERSLRRRPAGCAAADDDRRPSTGRPRAATRPG